MKNQYDIELVNNIIDQTNNLGLEGFHLGEDRREVRRKVGMN